MGMKVVKGKPGKPDSAGMKMPKGSGLVIIVGTGEHDRQAMEDAETLKDAEEIKKDPIRYAKAKKAMSSVEDD